MHDMQDVKEKELYVCSKLHVSIIVKLFRSFTSYRSNAPVNVIPQYSYTGEVNVIIASMIWAKSES